MVFTMMQATIVPTRASASCRSGPSATCASGQSPRCQPKASPAYDTLRSTNAGLNTLRNFANRARILRARATHGNAVRCVSRLGSPFELSCSPFKYAPLPAAMLHRRVAYSSGTRLFEDEESYKLLATVPGVSADDVKVQVSEDGTMSVSVSASGRRVLHKVIKLAKDADMKNIQAWCADGVLEVIINKSARPEGACVLVQSTQPAAVTSETHYTLRKNLPGFSADEVHVTLEPLPKFGLDSIHIHAKSANGYGDYEDQRTLPQDVDPSGAAAYCMNGVLTIQLPRKPAPEPVQVPVASTSPLPTTEDGDLEWKLNVPGYSSQDIQVEAKAAHLGSPGFIRVSIQGKERTITRSIALPDDLTNVTAITATCVNGVLRINVGAKGEGIVVPVASERPQAPTAAQEQPASEVPPAEEPSKSEGDAVEDEPQDV